MNARFQTVIHILTLLHHANGERYSSDYIAGSLNANPALVRKELSNLRKSGLIDSKEGKAGGYTLAKASDKITLADVYKSVKAPAPFGLAKNISNPQCPVGKQITRHISTLYDEVDQSIINKLSGTTLTAFAENFD